MPASAAFQKSEAPLTTNASIFLSAANEALEPAKAKTAAAPASKSLFMSVSLPVLFFVFWVRSNPKISFDWINRPLRSERLGQTEITSVPGLHLMSSICSGDQRPQRFGFAPPY